jgi:hypothetical protein
VWISDQPVAANIARTKAINYRASISAEGKTELQILLNTARHKIRMQTVGPLSVAVDKGMVFDYFDGLRKIVEEARCDIFFIDPYLDVDFVSNYLPFVNSSVTTRLLCGKRFPNVIAAAQLFAAQHNITIEVKRSNAIHDRFVFIDGKRGFQSGASFHQGGVKSPSILTEVTDTFSSTRQIYENIWKAS